VENALTFHAAYMQPLGSANGKQPRWLLYVTLPYAVSGAQMNTPRRYAVRLQPVEPGRNIAYKSYANYSTK